MQKTRTNRTTTNRTTTNRTTTRSSRRDPWIACLLVAFLCLATALPAAAGPEGAAIERNAPPTLLTSAIDWLEAFFGFAPLLSPEREEKSGPFIIPNGLTGSGAGPPEGAGDPGASDGSGPFIIPDGLESDRGAGEFGPLVIPDGLAEPNDSDEFGPLVIPDG